MRNIVQAVRNNSHLVLKLLPIISLAIPFLILYFFQNIAFPPYPHYYYKYTDTFEVTWKGRTYYIFFIWLALMETILGWDKLQPAKFGKQAPLRTAVFVLCLLFPTIYVIIANFKGLNRAIVDWTYAIGIRGPYAGCDWMPLAIEYLVFATFFVLIMLTQYGVKGIRNVIISPVFIMIMGVVFMIDNIYPEGVFTPFQIFVPTTAILAANVLGFIGYSTELQMGGQMPVLTIRNSSGRFFSARIAWPCAGVDSLIIYTVTILLFLRDTSIPLFQRAIYFTTGAVVTYFINILRITTIFIIGVNGGDWKLFHDSYGSFYSILWIVSYPSIIIGSRILWSKIRQWKARTHSLSSS